MYLLSTIPGTSTTRTFTKTSIISGCWRRLQLDLAPKTVDLLRKWIPTRWPPFQISTHEERPRNGTCSEWSIRPVARRYRNHLKIESAIRAGSRFFYAPLSDSLLCKEQKIKRPSKSRARVTAQSSRPFIRHCSFIFFPCHSQKLSLVFFHFAIFYLP